MGTDEANHMIDTAFNIYENIRALIGEDTAPLSACHQGDIPNKLICALTAIRMRTVLDRYSPILHELQVIIKHAHEVARMGFSDDIPPTILENCAGGVSASYRVHTILIEHADREYTDAINAYKNVPPDADGPAPIEYTKIDEIKNKLQNEISSKYKRDISIKGQQMTEEMKLSLKHVTELYVNLYDFRKNTLVYFCKCLIFYCTAPRHFTVFSDHLQQFISSDNAFLLPEYRTVYDKIRDGDTPSEEEITAMKAKHNGTDHRISFSHDPNWDPQLNREFENVVTAADVKLDDTLFNDFDIGKKDPITKIHKLVAGMTALLDTYKTNYTQMIHEQSDGSGDAPHDIHQKAAKGLSILDLHNFRKSKYRARITTKPKMADDDFTLPNVHAHEHIVTILNNYADTLTIAYNVLPLTRKLETLFLRAHNHYIYTKSTPEKSRDPTGWESAAVIISVVIYILLIILIICVYTLYDNTAGNLDYADIHGIIGLTTAVTILASILIIGLPLIRVVRLLVLWVKKKQNPISGYNASNNHYHQDLTSLDQIPVRISR